ncbi:ribosomal protein S5 domain 2-type protein [Polychytrium aggregatum]|uniref:ribosomal protein S5 domain 2-type protein n=1 Tax=Polychytrium aggregatum TaxID=110093 RepID=UPI0022FE38CC|nr:ribosomal protein S5 domain 2-type protein [Polychytrium aggregatum]KAI9204383.1 ribosomal protein S5 domain 2-type protein [Polychytrium aggregatum]
MPDSTAISIVSAPGKVLLAGGYLVLDRQYSGLVVGTSSRFFTSIAPGQRPRSITVKSPQFTDGFWSFGIKWEQGAVEIQPSSGQKENPYLEKTLCHTLTLASVLSSSFGSRIEQGLDIVIVGHNDFYSQREQLEQQHLPLTSASLSSLPNFCSTLAPIGQVHKTGLGSSAAMITSVVGALLSHFGVAELPRNRHVSEWSEQELYSARLVHNVAQFTHCLAQGKIGSGFDVSSAVFGSHSYRKFSPSVLDPLLSRAMQPDSPRLTGSDLLQALDPNQAADRWDNVVSTFDLPRGFIMMLADIDAGSSTPKLVSQVLSWRKSKPDECKQLWDEIHAHNTCIDSSLRKLCALSVQYPEVYDRTISKLAVVPADRWETEAAADDHGLSVLELGITIFKEFQNVRRNLRLMSQLAGVPIEPEEQTRLLDRCMQVPGVIMAGVPGAGGFDAIFCIVLSQPSKEAVEACWSEWKEMAVGPLLARESNGGISRMDLDDVPEFKQWLTSHVC